MRSEFTDVQKLFLLWREIEDKIDHYVTYREFFHTKYILRTKMRSYTPQS